MPRKTSPSPPPSDLLPNRRGTCPLRTTQKESKEHLSGMELGVLRTIESRGHSIGFSFFIFIKLLPPFSSSPLNTLFYDAGAGTQKTTFLFCQWPPVRLCH